MLSFKGNVTLLIEYNLTSLTIKRPKKPNTADKGAMIIPK